MASIVGAKTKETYHGGICSFSVSPCSQQRQLQLLQLVGDVTSQSVDLRFGDRQMVFSEDVRLLERRTLLDCEKVGKLTTEGG